MDESKARILKALPTTDILTFPVDVKNYDEAVKTVASTAKHFGKLDVRVIANAGRMTRFGESKLLRTHYF